MKSYETIGEWFRLIKSYVIDEEEERFAFHELIQAMWPHITIYAKQQYTNRMLTQTMNEYILQLQEFLGGTGDFVVACFVQPEFDIYQVVIGFSTVEQLITARLQLELPEDHDITGGGF